jgi:hypothetical protein
MYGFGDAVCRIGEGRVGSTTGSRRAMLPWLYPVGNVLTTCGPARCRPASSRSRRAGSRRVARDRTRPAPNVSFGIACLPSITAPNVLLAPACRHALSVLDTAAAARL